MPPAKKSNKALIIVLVILGIIFLLIASCGLLLMYGVRKARDFGEKYEKYPEMAGLAASVTIHPDLEIVSEDADKGQMTIRNKKTGEVVKIDAAQLRSGMAPQSIQKLFAESESAPEETSNSSTESESEPEESSPDTPKISPAKAAAMANTLKKFPDVVSAYPNATTMKAVSTVGGDALGGHYSALTTDSVQKVMDYYTKKINNAGLPIAYQNEETNDYGPTASMACGDSSSSIAISAETQAGGKVLVNVNFYGLKK